MNEDLITKRISALIDKHADGNAAKFARKAGIPQSTLHNYLKGRSPDVDKLILIRDTYNVSIDWILTGKGEMYGTGEPSKVLGVMPEYKEEEREGTHMEFEHYPGLREYITMLEAAAKLGDNDSVNFVIGKMQSLVTRDNVELKKNAG